MIDYKDYEKRVYDWLISKHENDSRFTFSIRMKSSKGAELDYFIGTEKSKYFATTFWTIPISYPGSSIDCIVLIFGATNDSYFYRFEFTQTKSPENSQNNSVLELIKGIKDSAIASLGFSYVSPVGNKMFSLKTNPRQHLYPSLDAMQKDIEHDLDVIIPAVNKAISHEKGNNPEFIAHPITIEEFNQRRVKLENRIKRHSKNIISDQNNDAIKYWLYAPGRNAQYWDEFYSSGIIAIGWDKLGNLEQYDSKDEIYETLKSRYGGDGSKKNNITANYEFCNDMQIGDIVIVKQGRSKLLGYGVVSSNYYHNSMRPDYKSCRDVEWKLKGQWDTGFSLVLKTLTDITKYPDTRSNHDFYYQNLMSIMTESPINIEPKAGAYKAPINQILYGPPGTGKTYSTVSEAAKIITQDSTLSYAESKRIFNENLRDRIEFITFHQSYSYEDFIQGLRPDVEHKTISFSRIDGIFTKIATNALFEYYKVLQKDNQLSDNIDVDLNDAYIEFVGSLEQGQEFVTKTGIKIRVDSFTDRNNIKFKPLNGLKSYLVSESRLLKLYEEFNDIGDIKRLHEDIREVIGGCNTSIYYVALREFISFLKIYKATIEEFNDGDSALNYEGVSYTRKKELLSMVTLEELRMVSDTSVPKYVIIIDEINRANISRVFGELITLIEKDKRSHGSIPISTTLPSGENFIVPSNLHIIGTMNTADKSIALLDIALRRRFEFVAKYPQYEFQGKPIHKAEFLRMLNTLIVQSGKGNDFTIGHSYFMGDLEEFDFEKTINNKVIPLLLEYYMNDLDEVKKILNEALQGEYKVDDWPLKLISTQ